MTNWWITARKAVTAFLAAGGATFVANLLGQFPAETVIYGSITVGGIAAIWRAITNGYKHRDD